MAKFAVGDQVLVKDAGETSWLNAVVKSVNPLEVLLGGTGTPFRFDEVKAATAKDGDVTVTNEDGGMQQAMKEDIIIEKPLVHTAVTKSHLVIFLLSIIQMMFVAVTLADGSSLMLLKDNCDLPTALSVSIAGVRQSLTMRQVLFYPHVPDAWSPYGIGADHDSFQRSWGAHSGETLKEAHDALVSKSAVPGASVDVVAGILASLSKRNAFHPAAYLSCDGLIDAGMVVKAFCYLIVIVCFFQAMISAVHILSPPPAVAKMLGVLTTLIQFAQCLGFFTVILLIQAIYSTAWTCNNPLIKTLMVSNHFYLNYGIGLCIVGFLASIVMLVLGIVAIRKSAAQINPRHAEAGTYSMVRVTNVTQGAVLLLSFLQFVMIGIALADGQSAFTLKENSDLPDMLTLNMSNVPTGINMREFLFYPYAPGSYAPYGIGPAHDSMYMPSGEHGSHPTMGHIDLKALHGKLAVATGGDPTMIVGGIFQAMKSRMQFHPAKFFACEDLTHDSEFAKIGCYLGVIAAFVQITLSAFHLYFPNVKYLGYATALLQAVLFGGLCNSMSLLNKLFSFEYYCDNPLSDHLIASHHFDLNYAILFVVIGVIASFIMMFLGCAAGLMGPAAAGAPTPPARRMQPQIVVVLLSVIQILFVAVCLADGQSVAVLKDDATLPAIMTLPIAGVNTKLNLREMLFAPHVKGKNYAPYGIGVNHDTMRRSFGVHGGARNLKQTYDRFSAIYNNTAQIAGGVMTTMQTRVQFHPAAFLDCASLMDHGWAARVFCFVAIAVATVQVLVSSFHIAQRNKGLGYVTAALQAVLAIVFLTVIGLIGAINGSEFTCDNPLIKTITMGDHFDLNYAIGFVVVAFLLSLGMIGLGLFQSSNFLHTA